MVLTDDQWKMNFNKNYQHVLREIKSKEGKGKIRPEKNISGSAHLPFDNEEPPSKKIEEPV